jgi:hypothetical protein
LSQTSSFMIPPNSCSMFLNRLPSVMEAGHYQLLHFATWPARKRIERVPEFRNEAPMTNSNAISGILQTCHAGRSNTPDLQAADRDEAKESLELNSPEQRSRCMSMAS